MVLPTHYYERIIEKLGGNPAQLPDRCECTMVDQIVNLIDNGIEGGGGGGGGFVFHVYRDLDGNLTTQTKYEEISQAVKQQPACLICHVDCGDGYEEIEQYQFQSDLGDAVAFSRLSAGLGYQDHTNVMGADIYVILIYSDGHVACTDIALK